MQNALDHVKWNGVVGARFANARREHKAKNPGARLLVGAHGGKQSRGRDARPGRQWPQAANQRDDAGHVFGTRQPEFVAQERRRHYPPRHRFTVLIDAVLRHRFQSVGECMPEIENFAQARLALILAHHAALNLHISRDKKAERATIPPKDLFHALLQNREHRRIRDDGVLDDLRESAAEFTIGECAQQLWIGEDQLGRIKRSDQVLPLGEIDAGFAADRTVHLRDERRRNVH